MSALAVPREGRLTRAAARPRQRRNRPAESATRNAAANYDNQVSRQIDATDTARGVGVFRRLGELVVRWPWFVIAFWILLAVGLPQMFPSLTELSQKSPVPMLPADAPGSVTARHVTEAFHESGSDTLLLVVLTNEKGLGPADEGVYRNLVDKLRRETQDVIKVQDFLSTPPLREVMTSKDGKAWILPVVLAGDLGSPQAYAASTRAGDIVKEVVAGSPVSAKLTGPAATFTDMTDIGTRDQKRIEIAMAIVLLAILLIIYRNPITMMLPLITIGVALVVAQGAVAGLGTLGLGVSNQTVVLLSAMIAGTGTDYAVFLISRYHDCLRLGENSDQAVKSTLNSIGKVVAASAATVAITFLGMVFTKLGVFSTVGVALAVTVGVGFLGAVTFLPAILVLAGRRDWIPPRRDLTHRFWRRSGIRIVRRPKIHLAASLLVLIALGSSVALVHYNYDDRNSLPPSAESTQGYDVMGRHFPVNSSLPQYLVVESPRDLRSPRALADLEQMAHRVSQLPDIEMVRGLTRPNGESLEQTRVSFQAGDIGSKLNLASSEIQNRTGDMNMLASGVGQMADVLGGLRGPVTQAIATVSGLVDAFTSMQNQFGGQKTLAEFDSAAKLVNAMRALGDSMGVNLADLRNSFDGIVPVPTALNTSAVCDADFSCSQTRSQLVRLVAARDDGTLDQISDLARQLRSTQGTQTLAATASSLRSAFDTAINALQSIGLNDPASLRTRLDELQNNANTLADASRQVADGIQLMVDKTKELGAGLDQASAFLLEMKNDATTPAMSGFYIPPQILTGDDFKNAAASFISADGHTARYLVQTKLNPFNPEAMDQVNAITDVARGAQPNTELADAEISMSGISASMRDIRDYYNQDMRLIILMTIVVVLVILMILLRAIVAPLYLVLSVVISYLSALGIGVLVFQLLLGQPLHWSVSGLTFIILVAVGADYNLLLISRIRDESPHGLRSGVIRTVGQTGGVITAAGLIFAATMLVLASASISTLVQSGFVVGVGILLDTFLVRTVTVPAIAVLVGRANWWPKQWRPELPAADRRKEKAAPVDGQEGETATAEREVEPASVDLWEEFRAAHGLEEGTVAANARDAQRAVAAVG